MILFIDLKTLLFGWRENIQDLPIWSQYCALKKNYQNDLINSVINGIESGLIKYPEDIVPCFAGNFIENILRHAIENSSLSQFTGPLHEKKIIDFRTIDQSLFEINKFRLLKILSDNTPSVHKAVSRNSEMGILLGQINRQRRFMSIRNLIKQTGDLIQKIKPCFMMSPLSIAQFLDPQGMKFDTIIFDEASQVKPEDAIGSLLRGNQLVVMGDTQQLPPTTFFDNIIEEDKDADEDENDHTTSLIDTQSILHQCKRSFPYKMLNWHYRSRHESLIMTSNYHFYDNRLQVFPASSKRSDTLGLKLFHIPDAIYDRGKSSINRKEAKVIAQEAVNHYRSFPDRSLGIGTFNIKQQEAIKEEIELQLHRNPDIQDLFNQNNDEHFFIKNLETIQGDERDTIFISVGYGRDEYGRMSLNFGPLNQEGGERRLNVLITRARQQCVVFSNIRATDFPNVDESPVGVRTLKSFIEYAETGILPKEYYSVSGDFDSPFEESVYHFLRDNGYEVKKQVGCARYKIDLAVLDPLSPNRYIIGIECDGATYHSSKVARERDRLRQQVLESLGWKLHRVWSTDWYLNEGRTKNHLIDAIKKAQSESKLKTRSSNNDSVAEKYILRSFKNNNKVPNDERTHYKKCTSTDIYIDEIISCPLSDLCDAIAHIIKTEGPIHLDDLVLRIVEFSNSSKSGERIKRRIKEAIDALIADNRVKSSKSFLWPVPVKPILVRYRSFNVKLERICNEEIEESIYLVLKNQHATTKNDLIAEAARNIGIKKINGNIETRFGNIINGLLRSKKISFSHDGMIDLP